MTDLSLSLKSGRINISPIFIHHSMFTQTVLPSRTKTWDDKWCRQMFRAAGNHMKLNQQVFEVVVNWNSHKLGFLWVIWKDNRAETVILSYKAPEMWELNISVVCYRFLRHHPTWRNWLLKSFKPLLDFSWLSKTCRCIQWWSQIWENSTYLRHQFISVWARRSPIFFWKESLQTNVKDVVIYQAGRV